MHCCQDTQIVTNDSKLQAIQSNECFALVDCDRLAWCMHECDFKQLSIGYLCYNINIPTLLLEMMVIQIKGLYGLW